MVLWEKYTNKVNNELFCISKLNSSFLKIPYSTSFRSFCNLLRTYAFWIDSFKALPSWFDVFQVQIDCRGEKRTSFGGEFSVNWIIISRQRHFKLGNHFPWPIQKTGGHGQSSYHFKHLFSTEGTHYLIKTIKKFNSYLPEQINRRK